MSTSIADFYFEEGSTYYPNGDIYWLAGIDVTNTASRFTHMDRIQIRGNTEEEAAELRNIVLNALKIEWYKEQS